MRKKTLLRSVLSLPMLLLHIFNLHANKPLFKYPVKARFAGDLTGSDIMPVSSAILNKDVVGLMLAAFPTTPIEDLAGFREINHGTVLDFDG